MNRKFSEQEVVRREKLSKLLKNKIDVFGETFKPNTYSEEISLQFGSKTREELEDIASSSKPFKITGRIMTKRGKGKAGFANLKDASGVIQIYVRKDLIGEKRFWSYLRRFRLRRHYRFGRFPNENKSWWTIT